MHVISRSEGYLEIAGVGAITQGYLGQEGQDTIMAIDLHVLNRDLVLASNTVVMYAP